MIFERGSMNVIATCTYMLQSRLTEIEKRDGKVGAKDQSAGAGVLVQYQNPPIGTKFSIFDAFFTAHDLPLIPRLPGERARDQDYRFSRPKTGQSRETTRIDLLTSRTLM